MEICKAKIMQRLRINFENYLLCITISTGYIVSAIYTPNIFDNIWQ